ncbi:MULTISPECIES: hypothetical protein [Sorangium]|uniref:Secreted protein n=1 Tax=Sorangium cellulosum TaxID=56 RepID=A0A4P2QI68_SORCE|nr:MULTISPECIES: hypothetical protein [Sorangium]AUX29687.1 hypothetical protein SOCE836_017780 [Sorangium cellulosum]WCQ89076.1 hypothetical protein NQZ70_01762 [Sorangium sp. Soce836]
MYARGSTKLLSLACVLVAGCAVDAGDPELTAEAQQEIRAFSVNFTNVVETVGLELVPTDEARALVPDEFVLAGEADPVTPITVRTAHADGISVNGGTATPGSVVQIGLLVVPPDGTGDVNSYTLWYYTDHALLALKLIQAGFLAQYVPNLEYDVSLTDSDIYVRVPFPGSPRLVVEGSIAPSGAPPAPFVANWWVSTWHGPVKQATTISSLLFGGADVSLATNAGNALGGLIGGSTAEFTVLDSFNQFPSAQTTVALAPF